MSPSDQPRLVEQRLSPSPETLRLSLILGALDLEVEPVSRALQRSRKASIRAYRAVSFACRSARTAAPYSSPVVRRRAL